MDASTEVSALEQVQAKTENHTDRIEQSQLVSVKKAVDLPLSAATVPGNDESDSTLIVPVLGSLEADSFRNGVLRIRKRVGKFTRIAN